MIETNLRDQPGIDTARGAAFGEMLRRVIEIELEKLGYVRIAGPGGALWAEPGASIPASVVKAIQEPRASIIRDE